MEKRRGAKGRLQGGSGVRERRRPSFRHHLGQSSGYGSRPDHGKSGAGDQNGRPRRHLALPCTTWASAPSTPPPRAARRPRDHRSRAPHTAVPPSHAPPCRVGTTADAPLQPPRSRTPLYRPRGPRQQHPAASRPAVAAPRLQTAPPPRPSCALPRRGSGRADPAVASVNPAKRKADLVAGRREKPLPP
jgi:hypothetical protein